MPPQRWNISLSVDHDTMDGQHRSLFALSERLWTLADSSNCTQAEGEEAIGALVDYTHIHFAEEEALLRSIGFPRLDEQMEAHQSIFIAIDKMIEVLSGSGQRLVLKELSEFVTVWLVGHISNEDLIYGAFLRDQRQPSR